MLHVKLVYCPVLNVDFGVCVMLNALCLLKYTRLNSYCFTFVFVQPLLLYCVLYIIVAKGCLLVVQCACTLNYTACMSNVLCTVLDTVLQKLYSHFEKIWNSRNGACIVRTACKGCTLAEKNEL